MVHLESGGSCKEVGDDGGGWCCQNHEGENLEVISKICGCMVGMRIDPIEGGVHGWWHDWPEIRFVQLALCAGRTT